MNIFGLEFCMVIILFQVYRVFAENGYEVLARDIAEAFSLIPGEVFYCSTGDLFEKSDPVLDQLNTGLREALDLYHITIDDSEDGTAFGKWSIVTEQRGVTEAEAVFSVFSPSDSLLFRSRPLAVGELSGGNKNFRGNGYILNTANRESVALWYPVSTDSSVCYRQFSVVTDDEKRMVQNIDSLIKKTAELSTAVIGKESVEGLVAIAKNLLSIEIRKKITAIIQDDTDARRYWVISRATVSFLSRGGVAVENVRFWVLDEVLKRGSSENCLFAPGKNVFEVCIKADYGETLIEGGFGYSEVGNERYGIENSMVFSNPLKKILLKDMDSAFSMKERWYALY